MVAVWDPKGQRCLYQTVYGHVFGKAAAVINFHRPQRLVAAMGKRWLAIFLSLYFDDLLVQDYRSTQPAAQEMVRQFMALIGLPLSPTKSVAGAEQTDF